MNALNQIQSVFQKHALNLRPEPFALFLEILNRWNRVHNLTSIRAIEEQVRLHILDSLSIARYLEGKRFLDVGSGGGFPGIPLAIAHPDQEWILLEKSEKKCRFLTQAVVELQLKNVVVVTSRVEDYIPESRFDGVVARAFSSLSEFVSMTQHLVSPTGKWYAMKGVYPEDELNQLPNNVQFTSTRILLSDLPEERHLICLRMNSLKGVLTIG